MTITSSSARMVRLLNVAIVALSFAGCAECYDDCGPTTPTQTETVVGSWVGRASGSSNAFISVFGFPDGRVVAYVVDGQQTAEWFLRQPYPGNQMTLTSHSGARLSFTMANDGFSTTFRPRSGAQAQILVVRVTAPAGLWFGRQRLSDNLEYRAGWVVLPSGEQQGAVVLETSRNIVATPSLTTSNPSTSVTLSGKGTLTVQFVTSSFADPTRFWPQ